jgi:tetratricopeptide (TPR) repeat protein
LAWIYIHSGKGYAARALLGKVLQIDPFTSVYHMMAGVAELMEGKFDDSLTELGKTYQMQKLSVLLYWVGKGLAYGQRFEEAFESFREVKLIDAGSFWDKLSSFFMFALQGRRAEALQVVTADFKKMAREDEMYPLWMAESYALVGELDEAVSWLDHGREWGFINYPFLQEHDPFLKNLRRNPRFKTLMERVKHEWEHFEV